LTERTGNSFLVPLQPRYQEAIESLSGSVANHQLFTFR
jgi:hypothetical protein